MDHSVLGAEVTCDICNLANAGNLRMKALQETFCEE